MWLSHWYDDGIQFHMKSIIVAIWLSILEETTRGNVFLDQEASKTGVVQRFLLFTGPSPVTAQSGQSVKSLTDLGISLPSTMGQDGHEMPQTMVKLMAIIGSCWLETGTWQPPLQRLNHGHYSCWTLTPPERSWGWKSEIRHSLCALGKMDKTGLQIVWYFQVKIFLSPNSCIFSYLEKH